MGSSVYTQGCLICTLPDFEISHPGVVHLFLCLFFGMKTMPKCAIRLKGMGCVWGLSYLVNCSSPMIWCFSSNTLHWMTAWPGLIWPCLIQNMPVRRICIYRNCWTCCWFLIFDVSSQATFGFTTSWIHPLLVAWLRRHLESSQGKENTSVVSEVK